MAIASTATVSPIAVLDEHGDIVDVNQAWKTFGEQNGLRETYTSIGKNYITVTQQSDDSYGRRVITQLRRLLAGKQTEFPVTYPCHSPNRNRWFRLYATAVSFGEEQYYVLVHQQLDRDQLPGDHSSFEGGDAPTGRTNYRGRNRLVTYSISSDESATEGLFMAFDAIGIDVQHRDTTLQDWIDSDVINRLQACTSEFHITFRLFDYPVGLNAEEAIIYKPKCSVE